MMEQLLLRVSNLSEIEISILAIFLFYEGVILCIFPEEVIITVLGFLWSQGRLSFAGALVTVFLGLLPANSATVLIASRFGKKIYKIPPFSWFLKKEKVDSFLSPLKKHGNFIIFFTRFIPLIRGPVYIAAGLSHFPISRFLRVDALAACIQVPLLLFLGGFIGKNADSLIASYQNIGKIVVFIVVIALVARWMLLRSQKKPLRS